MKLFLGLMVVFPPRTPAARLGPPPGARTLGHPDERPPTPVTSQGASLVPGGQIPAHFGMPALPVDNRHLIPFTTDHFRVVGTSSPLSVHCRPTCSIVFGSDTCGTSRPSSRQR